MTKRIIIAGTKSFNNYPAMEKMLNSILPEYGSDIEIVSGHAEGPDKFGERYAEEHNIKYSVFPADWVHFGKKAGFIRNSQMIDYASEEAPAVIAFWNGSSRGTLDTLAKAQKKGIETTVIIYGENGEMQRMIKYSYCDLPSTK